jgi:serine phosphatase RsbU (regulator of sigma subunit)
MQIAFKEILMDNVILSSAKKTELSNSRITVLLVDDQDFIGKIVGRMLEPEPDIDFYYFKSAREALKTVNSISPTVILQDLVMPEIDGLHMVYYFRAKKQTRRTPLIVLSASEDPKIKAEAFALGANDYMVKPPDKIELIARIRYHSQAYTHRIQRDEAHQRLEERTEELKRINEQLLEQIAERKRAEEALQLSKKKAEKEREAAEAANKKIMASIRYAKMIQSSLLPNPENIRSFLPESFFIWMPRDIVGGDFIFTDFFEDGFIIAVIDCTGHGVPGAFMTMIASFGLRKIIRDEGFHDPAKILQRLSFLVKTTLQQDTDYALSDDGLDAAICLVKPADRTLTYSGSKLPLFYINNDIHDKQVHIIKGDAKSIGYKKSDLKFSFTNHTVTVDRKISFYLFSDGFTDQLGEKNDRRFGTPRLRELLREICEAPFEEQRMRLLEAFNNYKGENERQDDVTALGFSLSRE